jgi:GntR family transcriptional regulator
VTESVGLDPSSGLPLYRQIKEILRHEIAEGRPGSALALTEAHLIKRFGVSRAPVRQALAELARDGYVYRRVGKGTFPISGVRLERPADGRPGYLHDYLNDTGGNARSAVSNSKRVVPPSEIAERLGLDRGEELLHFTHRITLGRRPIVESSVFVRAPSDFVPSSDELEAAASVFDLLEERFSIVLDRSEHEAVAIVATPEHVAALAVAPGTPLLAIDTLFFTLGGAPAGYRRVIQVTEVAAFRFVTDG